MWISDCGIKRNKIRNPHSEIRNRRSSLLIVRTGHIFTLLGVVPDTTLLHVIFGNRARNDAERRTFQHIAKYFASDVAARVPQIEATAPVKLPA